MFAIMHFLLAVAAFSKFAANARDIQFRSFGIGYMTRQAPIFEHTLFPVNQTGAVKDEWHVRVARNGSHCVVRVLYCGIV